MPLTTLDGAGFDGLNPLAVKRFLGELVLSYRDDPNCDAWFTQVRDAAVRCGFAPDVKMYRPDPGGFHGAVREAGVGDLRPRRARITVVES